MHPCEMTTKMAINVVSRVLSTNLNCSSCHTIEYTTRKPKQNMVRMDNSILDNNILVKVSHELTLYFTVFYCFET